MATKEKVENSMDMEKINTILSSFDKNFQFWSLRLYEKIEKTFRFRDGDNGYEYFYIIGSNLDGTLKIGINTKTMEVFTIGKYSKHYINNSFENFIKCMKYVNQKIRLDTIEIYGEEKEKVLAEIKEGIIKMDSKTFLDEKENWWPRTFIRGCNSFGGIGGHSVDFK
jgi:hypothetical protein